MGYGMSIGLIVVLLLAMYNYSYYGLTKEKVKEESGEVLL
jgi:hypothetical protein